MNSKEVNMIAMIVLTVFVLLILQKKVKINNIVLDFLFVCSIVIIGRKYLKISILLAFVLFLIKTNTCEINEGFQNEVDDLDKDDDSDEDEDSDEDDEPVQETSIYTNDCKSRCLKENLTNNECDRICKNICPDPIRYNKNLKELEKLRKAFETINTEK